MPRHLPQVLGIIPARLGSTRLQHKLLHVIDGTTVLRRTVEQVQYCRSIDHLIIAADDTRLIADSDSDIPDVVITEGDYSCGTDRCASILESYLDYDIVINIQGDQPYIDPGIIDQLADWMTDHPSIEIASLMTKTSTDVAADHVVKVSVDDQGIATDFSRQLRDETQYHHIGVYGYRRRVLQDIAGLQQTHRETQEGLEQLRWMEHGYEIHMVSVEHHPQSIDVIEDINNITR